MPELIIEVLSPSTRTHDRTEKETSYERKGVNEYGLVEAKHKEVIVFDLHRGTYTRGRAIRSGPIRSGVLPDLELCAEELFHTTG